jgi:cytidyltransferase-like protein
MKKIVLVTGGFDPIHSGHIEYFKAAKRLGDILIVGINSDEWLTRKKGRPFMPVAERISIIESLKVVDHCILFNDNDNSAIEAIKNVKMLFPNDHVIFANGGDRTATNIPEMAVDNVEFVFGVGGEDKKNSSSWILEEWKSPKTERPWGWYRVLEDKKNYKIKELVIEPGKRLSMQRHRQRSEHWYVLKGTCTIETEYLGSTTIVNISENNTYKIGLNVWHQGQNNTSTLCHILEVQHGEICIEEDIERK